ncbi:FMRFamide peptide receptor frpr-18-like [Lineus longissimus]|uniref:FMRFamide peptide receptor frpr-18-like n=1 Tax=Lineus longissimus TaxID=88925 RepID=UPI002B4F8BA7
MAVHLTDNDVFNSSRDTFYEGLHLNQLSRYTWLAVAPIIIFLGTVGNILTFVVLRRPSLRSSTTCFFLRALAMTDLLTLDIAAASIMVTRAISSNMVLSDFQCRVQFVVIPITTDTSCWILVAVTAERFIAVWKPLHARQICTVKKARAVVAGIVMVLLAINLPMVFFLHLDSNGMCRPYDKHSYFAEEVFPWVDLTIFSFAPFTLISTLNIAICAMIYLRTQTSLFRHQSVSADHKNNSLTKDASFSSVTRMLVVVDIAFLVTTSPTVLFNLWIPDWVSSKDPSLMSLLSLGRAACNLIMFMNNMLNFYLYILTGSKFRMELIALLHDIRTSLVRCKCI